MRTIVPVRLVLLALLATSPQSAQAQPPPATRSDPLGDQFTREMWRRERMRIQMGGSVRHVNQFEVESDTGVFIDNNGNITRIRPVDTTVTSSDDDFSFRDSGIDIGPSVIVPVSSNIVIHMDAAVRIGSVRLSHESQAGASAYEGTTGFRGGRIGGGAECILKDWGVIVPNVDWFHIQDGKVIFSPPRTVTGGRVTSERDALDGDGVVATLELAFSKGWRQRKGVYFSVGGGYLWEDHQLDREINVEFSPTVTTAFTGTTILTKEGPFGTVGAGFMLPRGFEINVEGTFGAQSGVTVGGSYKLW